MNTKENLMNIIGSVALFFEIYKFPPAAGGIICNNQAIDYLLEFTIEQLQQNYNLTFIQAKELSMQLEDCNQQIAKFPTALQQFISSSDFEENWNKMPPMQKDYILYMHEESYLILRKVKESHEIINLDTSEILKNLSNKIVLNSDLRKSLNLPEEFNELPNNKLQFLKQKKALSNLGYDTSLFNIFEFDDIRYTQKLINIVLSKKPYNELINVINQLNLDLPWHTKQILYFVEKNEEKITHKKLKI